MCDVCRVVGVGALVVAVAYDICRLLALAFIFVPLVLLLLLLSLLLLFTKS